MSDLTNSVIDAELLSNTSFNIDTLNNRIGRLKKPIVITKLDLPKSRVVHVNMLNPIDDPEYNSLKFISDIDRERMNVLNIAKATKPEGKVVIKNKDYSKYEMGIRRAFKKVKITNIKDKAILAPKDLLVINYKLLYTNYVYQQQKLRNYLILKNNLTTMIDVINSKKRAEHTFICLDVPEFKITISALNRWSKKPPAGSMESDFKTTDEFLVFEFWKMFFNDYNSIFDLIDKDKLETLYLLLKHNDSYTIYNMLDLIGMSKGSGVEGKLKPIRDMEAAKLFLLSMAKFKQRSILGLLDKGVIDTSIDDDIIDLDSELEELGISSGKDEEDDDWNSIDETLDVNNTDKDPIVLDTQKIKNNKGSSSFINVKENTKEVLLTALEEKTKNSVVSKNESSKLSENINEQDLREFTIRDKKVILGELLDYSNIDITNRYIPIKDSDTILDKTMLGNANKNLDKEYLDKLYYKDLYNAIYSIQNGKVVITDHKVEYKKSFMGAVEIHRLQLKPLDGRPSNIMFPIPVIDPETETYMMSANTYLLRDQRKDMPIRKTSPTTVLLTSYNGKLFIEKNLYIKNNPSNWIAKYISNNPLFTNIIIKPNIPYDVELPKPYTLISGGVSRFTYGYANGNIDFMFDYKNRMSLMGVSEHSKIKDIEKKHKLILVGRSHSRDTRYYMDMNGHIVSENKNTFKDRGDLEGYFGLDLKDMPIEIANIKVLGKIVPIGLVLLQYLGIDGLVKLIGRKVYDYYSYEDKYKLSRDEYAIKIKDGILVFNRKDTMLGLIFYGIPKDVIAGMSLEDLNNRDMISIMFNILGLSIAHINAINDMETLFLDNITKDALKHMGEPTDMHSLLLRAIEMLVDDNYKNPNNITDNVIVRYERIPGLVAKSLTRAVQSFNNRNTLSKARITLDPYEIWKNIGDDSTSMLVDNNNPIAAIKQRDNVTFLGEFGRSKITMTIPSRIMTPEEIGIISEASPDSGDSGISTYLAHSAEIKNIRGMVNPIDISKYSINKALSTANIIYPFIVNDSSNRTNFASIQSSHIIPMRVMKSYRILTGAEPVIASKAGKPFVYVAEAKGVVTKVVPEKFIEVEYFKPKEENVVLLLSDIADDVLIRKVYDILIDKGYNVITEPNKPSKYKVYIGDSNLGKDYIRVKEDKFLLATLRTIPVADTIKTKKSYSLRPWSSKVEGNSSIKHIMTTHHMVGSKVDKDEAISYDGSFFEVNIYDPKTIILKMGSYARVAFIEDKYTYEDSVLFNKSILKDTGEVSYKVVSKIVDTESHITNVLPEGTEVKYGMKLMTIMDSALANNKDISDRAREIMADSNDRSPKAKSNGVIDRIDVIYNCELEDMDASIRALADISNKRFREEVGADGRITNEYSINGKPLLAGEIELKYYISTVKDAITGDKFIVSHQLKNTLGSYVDDIVDEDGRRVDAIFGGRSASNRIVNSPYINGTTDLLMEYFTDIAVSEY